MPDIPPDIQNDDGVPDAPEPIQATAPSKQDARMTVSALTRPGERDRLIVKLTEIDWLFVGAMTLIAGAGGLMLFSIAGSSWTPWAAQHLVRYGLCLMMLIVLALVDTRVWFAIAYPVYVIGLLLLIAVEVVGDTRLGAQRWLSLGPFSFQPSEVMKIGIVLALARLYHGVSASGPGSPGGC
jgi:rod shape determining protein RodA